jgi:caffeoyl-CoA O-methyltransferase
MDIVHPLAEKYALNCSTTMSALLQKIESETYASHTHPHMISGSLQGKLLEMLCRMMQPMKVLEIGTFTGYSALAMMEGMPDEAVLHTIEIREDDANLARSYFNQSPYASRMNVHCGDAKIIITEIQEKWDLVFIDADKVSYIDYYELTLPKLNQGGWIIADNVLFHGQVLEDHIRGKNAIALNAFNKHVAADDRVEQLMMTIRDGLMLIRKK